MYHTASITAITAPPQPLTPYPLSPLPYTQALKNELDVLQALQHTGYLHIANLIELHEVQAATHAVLEYCSGGSVTRHLRSLKHGGHLSEAQAGLITSQLALALFHLHANGIAHRDVKAENVLYSDSTRTSIKLCDFGFAVICHDRKLRTVCGSPAYMAPELSRTGEAYYGPPVDLWALGCFAYEVLHGMAPFKGDSLDTLKMRIKRVDHNPFRKDLTQEAKRAIKLLLVYEPMDRCPPGDAGPIWAGIARQWERYEKGRREEEMASAPAPR